jgi:hypothetical protein
MNWMPGNCYRSKPNVLQTVSSVQADFFFGTFLPLAQASDNPIAIACFLLVTVLPLLRVHDSRRSIARFTSRELDREYFVIVFSPLVLVQDNRSRLIVID